MTVNTLYPLLTAWLNGTLRAAWNTERDALKRDDPKLLQWVVDHEAAARVSARLSMEENRLRLAARHLAWKHRSDPSYCDEVIEFYDALQDDALKGYRGILQDLSGNRSLIADEIRYMETMNFQYEDEVSNAN
jgi:hypothetical protein